LAYTSNILLTWKLWNWGSIAPYTPPPPRGYASGGNRILIVGNKPEQEILIEWSSCAHRFGN